MRRLTLPALAAGICSALLLGGCDKAAESSAPVSFQEDVKPILEANCTSCHTNGGKGVEASGLDMSTHASLMKGTRFGPVIEPGDPVSSTLVLLLEGKADPSINMPHGEDPLPSEQIAIIKRWIAQGASDT